LIVGKAATIRWLLDILPSWKGTLKSTLQKCVIINFERNNYNICQKKEFSYFTESKHVYL